MKKISAVIAAAGLGTRLKDYKDNSHTKVLIKIRQSSMISEQISQLSGWGIERFVIIANPEFYSLIKDDIDVNHADKDIDYAIQEKPLGIAHALLQSKDLIENNSKILFILGDNFFGENPIIDLDINKINNSVLFLKWWTRQSIPELTRKQLKLSATNLLCPSKTTNMSTVYNENLLSFFP